MFTTPKAEQLNARRIKQGSENVFTDNPLQLAATSLDVNAIFPLPLFLAIIVPSQLIKTILFAG